MRPSAAECDSGCGGREDEHINIRKVGCDHQRRAAKSRSRRKTCAAECGAHQRVTDVIHEVSAVSVVFSREANRQGGGAVAVMDVMCDPGMYSAAHFSRDGFHPNDAGHAHMASRLAAIVNGTPTSAAASCGYMTAF